MGYYRKRYYRRRNAKKSLSNYNIATKTGAKSQAKQIYFLKKRINKIQRLNKPEIIIIQRNSGPLDLVSTQVCAPWIVTDNGQQLFEIGPNLGPITPNYVGQITAAVPNNFARLHSFKLYGNMQYTSVSNTSVPVNVRIVIVQTRNSRPTDVEPNDVFTSDYKGVDNFSAVFGPLQTGLARTCKVLSDKRYCLSYQRPSINIRTSLKYLMSFYRDQNSSSSNPQVSSEMRPKGTIYVFYAIYTTAQESVGSLNLMYKLAYTDA